MRSPAANTLECAPMTLSTSVVPDRGIPRMHTRRGVLTGSAGGGTVANTEISLSMYCVLALAS